jgi:hypothetical protein
MTSRSPGWVAAGVALLAGLLLLATLRVPLLVAAVVIVPGFVVALAVLRERLAGPEGLLMTLLGSMSLAVMAGLTMELVGVEITPEAWWLFVAPISLAAAGVALLLRRADVRGVPLRLPRPREVAYVAAGLVLVSFALNISAVGARDARTAANESLAQLWILPGSDADVHRIGVENLGSLPGYYRVEVQVNGNLVETHRITVEGGDRWVREVAPRGVVDRLDVRLYPDGGTTPARHVWHLRGQPIT